MKEHLSRGVALSILVLLSVWASLTLSGCGGGGGHSSGGAPVQQTPAAQTLAEISPQSFSFVGDQNAIAGGAGFLSIATEIAGVGSSAVPWSATVDQSWLSVTPTSGAGATTVLVAATIAPGTPPGVYRAKVSVSVQGIAEAVVVPATLTVLGPPTGPFSPHGTAHPIHASFGANVLAPPNQPISLQDRLTHTFEFPVAKGASYVVSVDTLGSRQLSLELREGVMGGASLLSQQTVATPFLATVTATNDARAVLAIFDAAQANSFLSNVTITPLAQPLDTTGFDVIFHVAGDVPIRGFSSYNGLASQQDRTTFAADLKAAVNAIFPRQFQIRSVGIDVIPVAAISVVDPLLVQGGVVPIPSGETHELSLAGFGAPASDPKFGAALDVFLTGDVSAVAVDGKLGGVLGLTYVDFDQGGGVFVGNGPHSAIFMALTFFQTSIPLSDLATTLAHEMGHFLGLNHTTESTFDFDDQLDTPATPLSSDVNGDRVMSATEAGADRNYLMFWLRDPSFGAQTTMSAGQVKAVQDLLSIRPH